MNIRNHAAAMFFLGVFLSSCAAQSPGPESAVFPSPFPSPTWVPTIATTVEATLSATSTSVVRHFSQLQPLSLPEFNARYSTGDLVLTLDKKIMAVVSSDKLYGNEAVWLWNVNDPDRSLAGYQIFIENLSGVAFSPDGDMLAIGGEGKITILDWKTGYILDTIETPNPMVVQLAYGPD
ncbi:MAG: WD40 repeat domain-containing protein, partial [Anaerolineales bacterium]